MRFSMLGNGRIRSARMSRSWQSLRRFHIPGDFSIPWLGRFFVRWRTFAASAPISLRMTWLISSGSVGATCIVCWCGMRERRSSNE